MGAHCSVRASLAGSWQWSDRRAARLVLPESRIYVSGLSQSQRRPYMAKDAAPRPKTANGASNDHAAEQPESLDQVRDILFGGQMRMVDTRLRGLEERIAQEQMTLRNEFSRKLSELEEASKMELAAQAERLSAERAKRADELRALSVEFREAFKSLERRHLDFEEATSQADAEVRDQLVKQSAAFAAELSRTAERLTSELDRAESSLRAEKVDITSLAGTLTDMATRLTGGGHAAGRGSTKS